MHAKMVFNKTYNKNYFKSIVNFMQKNFIQNSNKKTHSKFKQKFFYSDKPRGNQ